MLQKICSHHMTFEENLQNLFNEHKEGLLGDEGTI
jgi:hypothetical protein